MQTPYILVLVTVGSPEEAREIARRLVEQRLAACVGLIPQSSIYRWQGKVTEDEEYLLTIKTTRSCFAALREAVLSMHSYEVPEIISMATSRTSIGLQAASESPPNTL